MNHRVVQSNTCVNCNGDHPLWKCEAFKRMTVDDRWTLVKERKICFCCLRVGHVSSKCIIFKQCNQKGCTKQHNGLLHRKDIRADILKPVEDLFVPEANPTLKHSSHEPVLFKVLPVRLYGKVIFLSTPLHCLTTEAL